MQETSFDDTSYRSGWRHGLTEANEIILRLMELGYGRRKIAQFIAIYDDHFVGPWRQDGDMGKKESFPSFDLEKIKEIAAGHRGYDWLLEE